MGLSMRGVNGWIPVNNHISSDGPNRIGKETRAGPIPSHTPMRVALIHVNLSKQFKSLYVIDITYVI